MIFKSQFAVQVPQDTVWQFLWDVEALAACIPGCEQVEPLEDGQYRAVVIEQVGPFRVQFQLKISLEEVEAPRFLRAKINGRDPRLASGIDMDLRLRLDPEETGTQVNLECSTTVHGKIAALGQGLIKKKSESIMEAFQENVRARLTPSPASNGSLPFADSALPGQPGS